MESCSVKNWLIVHNFWRQLFGLTNHICSILKKCFFFLNKQIQYRSLFILLRNQNTKVMMILIGFNTVIWAVVVKMRRLSCLDKSVILRLWHIIINNISFYRFFGHFLFTFGSWANLTSTWLLHCLESLEVLGMHDDTWILAWEHRVLKLTSTLSWAY